MAARTVFSALTVPTTFTCVSFHLLSTQSLWLSSCVCCSAKDQGLSKVAVKFHSKGWDDGECGVNHMVYILHASDVPPYALAKHQGSHADTCLGVQSSTFQLWPACGLKRLPGAVLWYFMQKCCPLPLSMLKLALATMLTYGVTVNCTSACGRWRLQCIRMCQVDIDIR